MSDSGDSDGFELAGFIHRNSSLFAVMGVFVAVAAYISQVEPGPITDAEMMIKSGFIASLGLAVLMMLLIYSAMKTEFGSWSELYHGHLQLSNWKLTVFSVLITVLFLSVTHIITLDEPVVFLLIITGTAVLGLIVFTRLAYGIGTRVPRTPVWRISTMFVVCTATLALTYTVRTRYLAYIEITTIQELSFSDPFTVVVMLTLVFVATIQSLAAVGIIAAIVGVPIVAFDKLRGKSPYDEPG